MYREGQTRGLTENTEGGRGRAERLSKESREGSREEHGEMDGIAVAGKGSEAY